MTPNIPDPGLEAASERWRKWQIRGDRQDRRTEIAVRIVGMVLFIAAAIALVAALIARPVGG
jgi:hypothetical protein